jgi:hypothetical protein
MVQALDIAAEQDITHVNRPRPAGADRRGQQP